MITNRLVDNRGMTTKDKILKREITKAKKRFLKHLLLALALCLVMKVAFIYKGNVGLEY